MVLLTTVPTLGRTCPGPSRDRRVLLLSPFPSCSHPQARLASGSRQPVPRIRARFWFVRSLTWVSRVLVCARSHGVCLSLSDSLCSARYAPGRSLSLQARFSLCLEVRFVWCSYGEPSCLCLHFYGLYLSIPLLSVCVCVVHTHACVRALFS